ncbi:MAG TPA: cation:proton antiporter [Ilumatobacteraceae bacterium]|nr:cation:proton antiporter [Ilumatobacteraceae bacterium]
MTAAVEAVDLGRLLLDLMIVLAAAKLGAELSEKLRIPAVLGEIVAGVIIGPSVLDAVTLDGSRGVSIAVIGEIGVLLLLLQVGMEMDLGELGKVGRASLCVAVIGVALPFVGGTVAGLAMGRSSTTSVFLGAALTATSVGITARVFGDLRALATTEARVVLGAAVADDVLGLVILTVVVKIVDGGDIGIGTIVGTLGLAVGFLVLAGVVGLTLVPKVLAVVYRKSSSGAAATVAALVITLGFAQLADAAKLAFIIGAFMAGLALGRSDHNERISGDLGVIGNVFIPVFFVQIGINTDLEAMAKGRVLGLAALLFVVAVIGKLASAWGSAGTRADRLLIGIGMIPRGEVGLIFASIGLSSGVLGGDLYGALLLVMLLSTVITPPLLRMRIGATGERARRDAPPPTPEPATGWLSVTDGIIHLNGIPAVNLTVPLALQAAARSAHARPGPELLEWFTDHDHEPLAWTKDDTAALIRLLRSHEPRGWRLLELTGVLERAVPEVAAAMRRRRADVSDLDPVGALRFHTAERLDHLAIETGHPSDELVLAALAADVCRDAMPPEPCSIALLTRLVLPDEAQRIAAIVNDARLLRASASAPSRFDEREMLQLVTHLGTPKHARDSYQLALALGGLATWQREALDEQHALIQEGLQHPELTGSEANNLAAARRLAAQRLLAEANAIERLRHAPTSYVLSQTAEELARQARLVEPLPRSGAVRVAVSPEPEPDHWKIDVACRDAEGLLAHLTNVLTGRGLDIVDATIATWPDGAVLDTFVVLARSRPRAKELSEEFESSLRRSLRLPVATGLIAEFDNEALPWHTACDVIGPDQPGALLAISAAFARAKVVVHTARVSTREGTIYDRFTLSDRLDRKLDAAAMERVQRSLAGERIGRRLALVR